ncbi:phage tail tape measure protein, partial [candidate division KSB1 bacterium RBG_16_48_16]
MADISKTVQILFSVENDMSAGLKDINDHIGTIDSSFGGLGGRAKDLAEDIALVGIAAIALATTFATFAVKEAAEFETAIQNINTILDETQGGQLPAIQAGILKLTEVLPQSAQDLAKAFYDIQSGIPLGEKGLILLETAAKAATAGLTSVQSAVSPFITILNSYHLGAEKASTVSDVLFQVVKDGVITFEQLAGGIGSVAALGAGLGQSIEQVGAAIVVLTKNTGQQDESFTRLVALYNQMAQTDTAEKLKAFGVEVLDVTGKMRPLDEIIGQMSAKQMTYQDIIKVFPEIRAAMGVNILVQDYQSLTYELNAMKNSQGATQAAFEKMIRTFDNQIKLLKNAWKSFLIVAGDPILEALKPIIEE